jgi:hypothetical protein
VVFTGHIAQTLTVLPVQAGSAFWESATRSGFAVNDAAPACTLVRHALWNRDGEIHV